MQFWILAGALSIAVALVIWRTVLRAGATDTAPTAAYDLEIYRDQLRELDRDLARGLISQADAERARTEISRRILDADRALQAGETSGHGGVLSIAMMLLLSMAVAFGTYFAIGAPGYPDLPLQTRIADIEAERAARPSQQEAEAEAPAFPPVEATDSQIAELEDLREQVAADPADTTAWFELARAEAQMRNYSAARQAQEQGIALMGPRVDARAYVALARMRILAAGGYISPEAEAALRSALSIDPQAGDARFLLGAMYQRQGRPDLAFPIWRDLLVNGPPDGPWVNAILEQIEEVAFFAGQRFDASMIDLAPGPTREQMEAAAEMSAADRMAMIEQMVAGLADRLATEGGPAENWARLIGAYAVLGQTEAAQTILAEARTVFAGDDAAQALLDAAAANTPDPAQ